MRRALIIRRDRPWLKRLISCGASAALAYAWGAFILPTGAQAAIAYLLLLPVCSALPCIALAFADQRWSYLWQYALGAAIGCALGAAPHSSGDGIGGLACFGAIVVWTIIGGLLGAALGFALSRLVWDVRFPRDFECPGCGYLLIGLTGQVCPECGRPFTLEELHKSPEELARATRNGPARRGMS